MMLSGVRVVEIGQALAAPFAAEILADLGADVIKVEKPDGGDDARHWGAAIWGDDAPMFHQMNRNKRGEAGTRFPLSLCQERQEVRKRPKALINRR